MTSIVDLTFNTGRLYQKEGQVIRACWYPEHSKMLFADFSRGCYGEIPVYRTREFETKYEFADFVMTQYDAGNYRMSSEALSIERPDLVPYDARI